MRLSYTMLPCTFDPGGNLGPMMTAFLWRERPPNTNYLQPLSPRTTTSLARESAQQTAAHVTAATSGYGLLHKANRGFRKAHPNGSFARHYSETLPSHWAAHRLGSNLLLAASNYLYKAVNEHVPCDLRSRNRAVHTAGSEPIRMAPDWCMLRGFDTGSNLPPRALS